VVIKEVEMRVEVPVEKIVIREVQVPAPTPQGQGNINQTKPASAWDSLKVGMTKSEVTDLLGEPNRVVAGEDIIYWYYSAQQSDFFFIRFKVAGFIGFDRVEYWMGPNQRTPKR
jgi:outer membrane protein assembly factor BamE (lipoprotein component of BamABCDE complex)